MTAFCSSKFSPSKASAVRAGARAEKVSAAVEKVSAHAHALKRILPNTLRKGAKTKFFCI